MVHGILKGLWEQHNFALFFFFFILNIISSGMQNLFITSCYILFVFNPKAFFFCFVGF